MKKIFFLTILTALSIVSFSQSDKYITAMKKNIDAIDSSFSNPTSSLSLANNFERIGDAEKNQWLPFYYAALTKARMSMNKMGDQDQLADEAQNIINKAIAIEKNSEIMCVESMIATAKMLVDPQSRWMQYGQASMQFLEDAKKADSTNPRPFALQSISLKNTPEAFGGGCGAAKPVAEKAIELLISFKPASALHPKWGNEIAQSVIDACK